MVKKQRNSYKQLRNLVTIVRQLHISTIRKTLQASTPTCSKGFTWGFQYRLDEHVWKTCQIDVDLEKIQVPQKIPHECPWVSLHFFSPYTFSIQILLFPHIRSCLVECRHGAGRCKAGRCNSLAWPGPRLHANCSSTVLVQGCS